METGIERYHKRLAKLESAQSEYRDQWKVLRDYFWPRHGRFLNERKNDGKAKGQLLINNAAIMARRTLQSGMQAGITNESRPWFKFTTSDPDLMKSQAVKSWLETVEERVRTILSKSNAYTDFLKIYGQLGVFGTSSQMIQEDWEDVIRGYQDPIGSFFLASNSRDVVDTRYRRIKMTVEQMVGKFGYKKCSDTVKRLYDKQNYDEEVDVIQVVEPRHERDVTSPAAKDMPYSSVYFEEGADKLRDNFLKVSGYEDFPCVAPRWELNGTNTYGDSPGMDALGDNKQLQLQERRKGQAIDKGVSPPLVGNGQLAAGTRVDLRSNKTTWVNNAGSGQALNAVYQINPQFVAMLSDDSQGVKQRIDDAFYVDMFMMISQSDRRQVTAREIEERHEEKLLMLGPVLNRLRDELYDPYLRRVFKIALRTGAIPPPPEEMQKSQISIDYISILHQAQQAVGLVGIDRYLGFAGNLVAVDPTAMDYVDTAETMRAYHRMTGAPAMMMPSDETIKKVQAERAKAQQAEQAMAQAQQGADTAKVLSEARTDDPSALNMLMQGMGG